MAPNFTLADTARKSVSLSDFGGKAIRQLPTSVLIGPDLKVLEVVRGVPPLRDPEFHARIESLVRTATGAPGPQ